MVTSEWFCQVMGSEVGPLSPRELVEMIRRNQLSPEDLVRRGSSGWVPAFEVNGLLEAAAKPATSETEPAANQSVQAKENPKPAATKSARESGAASGDSENDWYCIASGEKRGPLGFEQLRAMASNGTLRGRDRVWRASSPKFRKATEVDGLEIA